MESFLAGYGGCLLVASHDRAFMEGLDRLFVLRGDGVVRLFEGSYSEVLVPYRSFSAYESRSRGFSPDDTMCT